MPENEKSEAVYKQLSEDMREGLKGIYKQITNASQNGKDGHPDIHSGTENILHEATDQLDVVLRTTENATMTIMELVEKSLANQEESAKLLAAVRDGSASDADKERLLELNTGIGDDLTALMTTLSFQDITGQRIKKVLEALKTVEESVLELYVSSGLILDGADKNPEMDARELKDEVQKALDDFHNNRQVTSTLRGPNENGIKQNAIDDMLAQLGL